MISIDDWREILASGAVIIAALALMLWAVGRFLSRGGRLKARGIDIREGDSLALLVATVQALCSAQPYLIKALRAQNAAFRELGANGSTVESDRHLDDAQACLNKVVVDQVGACK